MITRQDISSILLSCLIALMVSCRGRPHSGKSDANQHKIASSSKKYDLPKQAQNLKNLMVYSVNLRPPDTVKLIKEQVFKSSENVYFNGFVGPLAVDNQNRVYIAVVHANAAEAVYIFGLHGHFIKKIGGVGKGPGEFLAISNIQIQNNHLYIYDPLQYKISKFALKNFQHLHDVVISRDSIRKKGELATFKAKRNLFIRPDHTYLIGFLENNAIDINKNRDILYYRISKRGEILPGKILKVKRYRFYTPNKVRTSNGIHLPRVMPFSRRSFVAVSRNGAIYTNWSEHFLIKVYNKEGHYKRAFYYSYKNSPLSLFHLKLRKSERLLVREHKGWVPTTWPAAHTMFMDDKDRLWVFTITDSKAHYKGWVLNKKGKLLARFNWPGKRASQSIMSKPVMLVKNGYLYKREIDLDKGLNQIVKYKIQFKKNK